MIKLSGRPTRELRRGQRMVVTGNAARDAMIEAWRGDKAKFKPNIDGELYGSIKDDLIAAQGDKCCFCETKITAWSHGDVEHYRPKKGVTEDPSHGGYWWLAYEPTNLLLSCQVCNQIYKRNKFPLEDETKRAKTPDDVWAAEEPLLLDPYVDEPEEHIGWRAAVPYGKTERGKKTIEIVGLARTGRHVHPETGRVVETGLSEARAATYDDISALYDLWNEVESLPPEHELMPARLKRLKQHWERLHKKLFGAGIQYQAMIRAAFKAEFERPWEDE
jgi:hypothetical protein